MTEVQDDHTSIVRFEEIQELYCNDSRIILQVVGKFPGWEVDESIQNQWICIATYSVALDKLVRVGNDVDFEYLRSPGFNIPVFEFSDGFYMLEQHSLDFKVETQAELSLPLKPSLTFNSLLKLNKLVQYITQAEEETNVLRDKIDDTYKLVGHEDMYFRNSMVMLSKRIDNLREGIQQTKNELENSAKATELKNGSSSVSLSENYGLDYSTFEHDKGKMLSLQRRRLLQFLGIIKELNLSCFITIPERALSESPFLVDFHVVDFKELVSTSERELTNSQLGHYLLILGVLAEHILFIPLPFSLSFRGSYSTIDNNIPFFVPSKLNQQALEDFNKAVLNFNVNVNQIKQYMEHHR